MSQMIQKAIREMGFDERAALMALLTANAGDRLAAMAKETPGLTLMQAAQALNRSRKTTSNHKQKKAPARLQPEQRQGT